MPPVVEGSFVVGEFVQNWMSISNGTPCVIITKDEGVVFKVIHNLLESKQSFQLSSTNTFYEPYYVHVNDILEIWKFVNYISPELPDVRLDDNNLYNNETFIDYLKVTNLIKNQDYINVSRKFNDKFVDFIKSTN